MKAYQKMLRKLCLEICPKVYFVSLMYGFGDACFEIYYRKTVKIYLYV